MEEPEFVYDDEASETWRMDVVHEVPRRSSAAEWASAQRRLNAIDDPLARKLIHLHRKCGSGAGVCDDGQENTESPYVGSWPCETVDLIAAHFAIPSPGA